MLLLCTVAQVWLFGLPAPLDFFIALSILLIWLFAERVNFLLIFFSISLTSIGIFLLFNFKLETPDTIYREHEKYYAGASYKPLVKDTIECPYGDLLAVDPTAPKALAEPRKIYFQTDSLGFRNREELRDQEYVLSGDSFVVASTTTQEESLPEVLSARGVSNYSIGFPGPPQAYDGRAAELLQNHPGQYQFAFFYYEGNDFQAQSFYVQAFEDSWQTKYYKLSDSYDKFRMKTLQEDFPFLLYPYFLNSMRQRVERTLIRVSSNDVRIYTIFGKEVGFLEIQNFQALSDNIPIMHVEMTKDVVARTKCAFFIPTKFRTYASELPEKVRDTILWPPPAFIELQKLYANTNVKVVDLTPPLRKAAEELGPRGEFVFWRDDTHWNGKGIAAVATTVEECLKSD